MADEFFTPQKYVLQVPFGFEQVVVRYVAALPGVRDAAVLTEEAVELDYEGPLEPLLRLRVADGVFRMLGVFLSSHSLDKMMQNLASQVELSSWNRNGEISNDARGKRFCLTIELDPTLGVSYPDFRSEVTWMLQATLGARPGPSGIGTPIHLTVGSEAGWVGVGCTEQSLGVTEDSIESSLPSTVAAGMVLWAGIRPDDVFLDPLCASGEILIERANAGPVGALLAGDVELGSLKAHRPHPSEDLACVCRWDPRRLPLKHNSVDVIVTSLPFGNRTGAVQISRSLYRSMIREIIRLLKPTGRALLLAVENQLLAELLRRRPELVIETRQPIRRGGFRAHLFVVRPVLKTL